VDRHMQMDKCVEDLDAKNAIQRTNNSASMYGGFGLIGKAKYQCVLMRWSYLEKCMCACVRSKSTVCIIFLDKWE
jgi:hypothetical protein